MAKKLTSVSVSNAKAGKTRREISDGGSGLWLVVQPSGKKSWAVRYRHERVPKKLTLAATSLADARVQAAEALRELKEGRDPAVKKLTIRQAKAERARDTVDALAAEFIEKHAKKKTRPSSWKQCESVFKKEVLPAWSGKTVHDIRKRDVVDLVEGIAEDRPIYANRSLGHLRVFFNWLVERDVLQTKSPCAGVKAPADEKSRDYVLTVDEIKALWAACDETGGPFSALVKVLLLTGQRRTEVARIRWPEINVGAALWELPRERNKTGAPHNVPLSAQVMAILTSLPHIAGPADFVFTNDGVTAVAAFSRGKRRLDKHMKTEGKWRLHDLRRTCASGLQKLGVPIHITEAVLGHRSGVISGIARVYQRHDYADEKRIALQRWADHVDNIVGAAPTSNVRRLDEHRGHAQA